MNARLERAIKSNYRLICDIAEDRPRRSEDHDSTRPVLGKRLPMRLAAMVLALKRIEAHYMLEGFSNELGEMTKAARIRRSIGRAAGRPGGQAAGRPPGDG